MSKHSIEGDNAVNIRLSIFAIYLSKLRLSLRMFREESSKAPDIYTGRELLQALRKFSIKAFVEDYPLHIGHVLYIARESFGIVERELYSVDIYAIVETE